MKALFDRDETIFALVWIVIYVVGFGNAGVLTDDVVTNYAIQVAVGLVMAVALVTFARKNDLLEYWGLCPLRGDARRFLWFVPLLVLMSENVWLGLGKGEDSTLAMVLGIAAIGVMAPILEELVLRVILYRALGHSNALRAFVVCSVTFGVGHIVNLLFGHDLARTLIQVCYALCIGFCLTAVLHAGRSIVPITLAHIEMNTLGFFANQGEVGTVADYVTIAILCVGCIAYGIYVLRAHADERPLTGAPLEW